MGLSKTNTDTLCLDVSVERKGTQTLRRWVYLYNIWTGYVIKILIASIVQNPLFFFAQASLMTILRFCRLYMLEPHEKWALHLFFGSVLLMGFLYTYIFWKGFIQGFLEP